MLRIVLLIFLPAFSFTQYAENDWEDRDTWMNIPLIFEEAGIHEGSYVADIGCHEGYLSIHLANKVGVDGKVYAVDVREDRIELLDENLKARDFSNVATILGDYDDPKLPINTLDVVFIVDTYHEMEDYAIILKHVYQSLKSGGRIVIIEKLKSHIKGKSRADQIDAHSLAPKYVKKELTSAGFKVSHQDDDMGDWENDEDKVIWMLIAEKE